MFVRAARALLFSNSIKLAGVGIYNSEDRRIFFRSEPYVNCIRARILRQSKLSDYIIIDRKVVDGHRSKAENPIAHAL